MFHRTPEANKRRNQLTKLPSGVPSSDSVKVSLECTEVEEGPFLVKARHLDPLVVAGVIPEHSVHRCLAFGVIVALAAHHVQKVANDGDTVLVAGCVHRCQRLPLVSFLIKQTQLLTDHELLPQNTAQRDQVGAIRADGCPF